MSNLKLPLKIDKVNRVLNTTLLAAFALTALSFVGMLITRLLNTEEKYFTYASDLSVTALALIFIVIVLIFITKMISSGVRKKYAPQISQWCYEKYGITLSEASSITLSRPARIHKSEKHNTVFMSIPIVQWDTGENGIKYPYSLILQGFVDGEYILYDTSKNTEALSELQKAKQAFFKDIIKEAKINNLFTFIKPDTEDPGPSDIIDFSDPRDNQKMHVFWTDELALKMYTSENDLPYDVAEISYYQYSHELINYFVTEKINVGFNWGQEKSICPPEDVKYYFLS